jgi:hypothetical protein
MPKRRSENEPASKGKVRVLYVELEGSDSTLQEALRTVERMRRPVELHPPETRRLAEPAGPNEAGLFDGLAEEPSDVVDGEIVDSASDELSVGRTKRGQGPRRDRNAGLGIVKELNLRPEGKPSLKDFFASKKPKTQMEQMAVFAFYLKKIAEEAEVGYNHLFTCFDETSTRKPEDLAQTARNTASKKGWIDTSKPDDVKITTRGENLVDHELPRDQSASNDGD